MVKEHIDTTESTVSIDGISIDGIDPESLPFPKPKRGSKSVTTLKDRVMRNAPKILDPGEASFSGIRIPGDAGQTALVSAADDAEEHIIQITIPEAGLVFEFAAFVSTFYEGQRDENTLDFTVDLQCTGGFVRSATSAGITSIEGAGVGIAYSPAAANTALPATATAVIFKEATGITTDTVEVTAASASYIGISYNNGSTWTTLTSGTAASISSTYWPAAGALSEALIMVQEDLKATRFVKLFIARA